MSEVKDQIQSRIDKEYFGFQVKQALPKLSNYEQATFKKEALNAYIRALDYLKKWFDFESSVFKKLKVFKLDKELPTLDEVLDICTEFNIQV